MVKICEIISFLIFPRKISDYDQILTKLNNKKNIGKKLWLSFSFKDKQNYSSDKSLIA